MLDAAEVDRRIVSAAIGAFAMWVILLSSVYTLVPDRHWSILEGAEREMPFMASVALITILVIFCVPFLNFTSNTGRARPSGIVLAGFVVIAISIFTNLLFAFAPTAVMVDPVTGVKCFLIRWCAWIPLAGLMTFMSEAIDMSEQKHGVSTEVVSSFSQLIAATCGLVFPFCPDIRAWGAVCTFAVVTYQNILHRTKRKYDLLTAERKGVTVLEKERYHRRYYAYHLLKLCSIIWTVLVVIFFINVALHVGLPEGHALRNESFSMLFDTSFDVLAKGLYLKIILDVHKTVFDSDARVERQFKELRKLMKVLWDSTTDVIIISVRGRERASSVLSPSHQNLFGVDPASIDSEVAASGMLLQTSTNFSGSSAPEVFDSSYIDSHHIMQPAEHPTEQIAPIKRDSRKVKIAVDLIQSCWKNLDDTDQKDSILIVHEFVKQSGEICSCEIKLSRRPDSYVAIVRDVTERVKRFKAEQRATAEASARQRDAQSVNRFTRHEVKNGLLSGIELCDRLQRSFQAASNNVDQTVSQTLEKEKYKVIESEMIRTAGMIGQVDQVLHEILDTVLAEAMARDVIYEIYKPSPKKVDLVDALRSSCGGIGIEPRFPLVLPSEELPNLMLDSQLLRYIHRNAISNASKYGKVGGTISTHVCYNVRLEELKVEVVNESGDGHEKLVAMGQKASAAVFQQSTRLHDDPDVGDNVLSSGDGAWIMQKCAKNMGGFCSILFKPEKTKFIFQCRAAPVREGEAGKSSVFELPSNTWGIGIDDSWIQRKLLLRIFSNAGIQHNRKKVLGRNTEELDSVGLLIGALLDEDPDCKVLVLVDENLDFCDENGLRIIKSGSKMMGSFLENMSTSKRDRVLALVRSANDSSGDQADYTRRTHGFCPKTATKKEDFLEILETQWPKRFGSKPKPKINIFDEFDDEEGSISKDDLREVVASVDVLLQGKSFRDIPWSHLWSALHSLKGDIMISENEEFDSAAQAISSMRGSEAPDDFEERWKSIRESVMKGIDDLL